MLNISLSNSVIKIILVFPLDEMISNKPSDWHFI